MRGKLNGKRLMATFEGLNFDNQALKRLPIEEAGDYLIQRPIPNACFSRVKPTPIETPKIVSTSTALELLDLNPSEISRPDSADYLCGNKEFPGAEYAAHCYCGHQFGQFAGQLGDGATMYVGEIVNKLGERWELQFKGAGKTPFSRTADGRKVLRSSIREYLCSEAMHHLGIPTTRAGSCVTSFDTRVVRDKFYDGHSKYEPTAVITRIAPTFIRFGSFEIIKPGGPSAGKTEIVTQLADYIIQLLYTDIIKDDPKRYEQLIAKVCQKTAKMVARWQLVGWCHGVLNTDNMSVAGITIDYGPFGFIDRFDPDFICNASDDNGRYSYSNQPTICKWNIFKWCQMLEHLVDLERAKEILQENFDKVFYEEIVGGARKKFGLSEALDGDQELYESFLQVMLDTGADFTDTFRALSMLKTTDGKVDENSRKLLIDKICTECCYSPEECQTGGSQANEHELRMLAMMLRHGMLDPEQQVALRQKILEAEQRASKFKVTAEEKSSKDRELWSAWFEVYSIRLEKESLNPNRSAEMDLVNPKYILRNHILEKAISAAENGDFSVVNQLLEIVQNPYKNHTKTPEEPFQSCAFNFADRPKVDDMTIKVT